MSLIYVDKVTLNIGMGQGGEQLQKAKTLIERVSGSKAVLTKTKARNPTWKLRQGETIGTKVTLRGKKAADVLKRALETVGKKISERSFDKGGNVAFGIKEYIDFPGMKYDPEIGMLGFDVCVTLKKKGSRIALRKIAPRKLPAKQRVSQDESRKFMAENFGVQVVSAAEAAQ